MNELNGLHKPSSSSAAAAAAVAVHSLRERSITAQRLLVMSCHVTCQRGHLAATHVAQLTSTNE